MEPRAQPNPPMLAGIDLHLARRVPVAGPADVVADVRANLAGGKFDPVGEIAICEGPSDRRRLVGLVPMARFVAAADDVSMADLVDRDPPTASPGLDTEPAAWKAVQHGESSLAVVDADGQFRGLVPSGRLLGALLSAHDQDFARLGGYLASTESARHAVEEPLLRRLWHRVPWLLVGLAGAGLSAWLVGLFEGRLADDVRVAFFIPGVVYMADAVGTQTEALVIRGMSVGAQMRTAFRLEGVTGPVAGVAFGLVALPLVWLLLGSFELGLTVAIALAAACSVATLVACVLPWLMERSGQDPAFGSGPLATVVQDLVSLAIYLGVAQVILG
jgi:magnesium transporter